MTKKDKQDRASVAIDAAMIDGTLQLGRCYAIVTVSPMKELKRVTS